jgi:hypothetical protein
VEVPLGDFFAMGHDGAPHTVTSLPVTVAPLRGCNCYWPMPFRLHARVTLENQGPIDANIIAYAILYQLGTVPDDAAYFHAQWRRSLTRRDHPEHTILDGVAGRGVYVGTYLAWSAFSRGWWGEGEVKFYLDGDREFPTLSGTGAEDYIGTAWGQGQFAHWYQGSPVADEKNMRWCFYRYHIPDPIYFYKDIRVTIQQIGYLAPHSREQLVKENRKLYRAGPGLVEMDTSKDGKFERDDDYSSCTYFYLDRPENNLPPLDPVAKRVEGL